MGVEILEGQGATFTKLVKQLLDEGWRMQTAGVMYLNGEHATNLMKDGEMMHVSLNSWPDQEFIRKTF